MSREVGGIALRGCWLAQPRRALERLGFAPDVVTGRVRATEFDANVNALGLAYLAPWTVVLAAPYDIFGAIRASGEDPLERAARELADEVFLWVEDETGDSYGFVHATPDRRRALWIGQGEIYANEGAPEPWEPGGDLRGERTLCAGLAAVIGLDPGGARAMPYATLYMT